jgi:hypothetical protein
VPPLHRLDVEAVRVVLQAAVGALAPEHPQLATHLTEDGDAVGYTVRETQWETQWEAQ